MSSLHKIKKLVLNDYLKHLTNIPSINIALFGIRIAYILHINGSTNDIFDIVNYLESLD
jgi:hypothetical protein